MGSKKTQRKLYRLSLVEDATHEKIYALKFSKANFFCLLSLFLCTLVGAISGIDDTTANVLFEVERPDMTSVHVPAAEPLITDVDPDARTLTMSLPTGLF